MIEYINGNTHVSILDDGTKIRTYENDPIIIHPESIDIKITDYCDMGCEYCHESSTMSGIHGDLEYLLTVIKDLPAGVEVAIGGGNPLSHPKLTEFLHELKNKGIIANLTVNQGHLQKYFDLLKYYLHEDLIKGLGISIIHTNFKTIRELKQLSPNIVYHIIAGVHSPKILDELITIGNCKVLILGYKQFGFGVKYYSPELEQGILTWKKTVPAYIGKCLLAFDNLAIEQLSIRKLFTKEGWEKYYMGNDFQFTMYIDAVKKEYAPTSRSKDRVSFHKMNLLEFFSTRNNGINLDN